MNKKILVGSIGAALILVLTSYSSVLAIQTTDNENRIVQSSPIFIVQTMRATNEKITDIETNYLRKGESKDIFSVNLVPSKDEVAKAFELFEKYPQIFINLLSRIQNTPRFAKLLGNLNIEQPQLVHYLRVFQNNPQSLSQQLQNIQPWVSEDNDPHSLGLSTSNPLGCYIVAIFALLPVTIVITLLALFFTLRIITCLNINDCANTIAQSIWESLLQGLQIE